MKNMKKSLKNKLIHLNAIHLTDWKQHQACNKWVNNHVANYEYYDEAFQSVIDNVLGQLDLMTDNAVEYLLQDNIDIAIQYFAKNNLPKAYRILYKTSCFIKRTIKWPNSRLDAYLLILYLQHKLKWNPYRTAPEDTRGISDICICTLALKNFDTETIKSIMTTKLGNSSSKVINGVKELRRNCKVINNIFTGWLINEHIYCSDADSDPFAILDIVTPSDHVINEVIDNVVADSRWRGFYKRVIKETIDFLSTDQSGYPGLMFCHKVFSSKNLHMLYHLHKPIHLLDKKAEDEPIMIMVYTHTVLLLMDKIYKNLAGNNKVSKTYVNLINDITKAQTSGKFTFDC